MQLKQNPVHSMPPSNSPITAPDCPCGKKPITAWGVRDGYWTVVIACREPENHEARNELYCVVTRHPQLNNAVAEAEKMWLLLRTTKSPNPSNDPLNRPCQEN
jgi:hypothetical protein